MIERLQGHWGFTRTPFGRDLAPSMLHRHRGHGEAVARITWAISERALAVITGEVAALDQRIAVRYHLTGMSAEETTDYLRHHLALAGRTDTLFSDDAIALIHTTSRGYPRAVNNLAIAALLAAYTANKTIVDESSARTAVTEVTTE